MRIRVDTPNVRDIQNRLGELRGKTPQVMARAINDASVTGKKVIAQEIAKTYTVKSGDIKKALDVSKATPERTKALIKTNRKGAYKIPLYAHKLSPKKAWNPAMSVKPRPKKYKVQIKKTEGAKEFLHGFVAQMNSGHVGFFVRKNDARHKKNLKAYGANKRVRGKRTQLGIKEVYSQAIAQMAGKESTVEIVTREAQATLTRRLEHEISRVLGGH